jgi:hypothetical protein
MGGERFEIGLGQVSFGDAEQLCRDRPQAVDISLPRGPHAGQGMLTPAPR